MTLVSSIINDAYRETNINAIGTVPSDDQNTEALRRLQNIVSSVLGNEAGENFLPIALGRNEIDTPQGYPGYNNELPGKMFMPVNAQIMCNLTGAGTVWFHPKPDDGARMSVVDVSANFGSFPLTINGNGRSIEADDAVIMNTSAETREWFYRADLANWVKVTGITLTSEMPFPAKFDDMFIIMLAARMNPRNGQQLDPASSQMLQRARTQFRAQYKQNTQAPSEQALLYLTSNYRLYGRRGEYQAGGSERLFNSGYPYNG